MNMSTHLKTSLECKPNVIYADPPWSYNNKATGGSMSSGVESQYKSTMTTSKIMSFLEDENIETQDDALLFLWGTVPMLRDAMSVLIWWNFEYKTMYTWNKTGMLGMGFWYRVNTEHLLVGVKGKVKPFGMQYPNIYNHKVMKHSEKPEYFRHMIEQCASKSFKEPKYLELFARKNIDGWDAIGNELSDYKTARLV